VASNSDALGDRMKDYEAVSRFLLSRRTYTIIRVDGRAFHSYLRDADKPFDYPFMLDMAEVAKTLCEEISGAVFAYHQSDEISMLVQDFDSPGTQPWFGGVLAKVVSMSAAIATAKLNALRPGRALFDSRAFTVADRFEVGNYFIWRQRDAVRNSISMAAQAHFSPRQLHGVNGAEMQEMLWSQRGVNWNDYPVAAKRGQVAFKESGERDVTFTDKRSGEERTTTAMRSWWTVAPADHFTLNDGWLIDAIPVLGSSP
jgi:tRNA(His) 5'-end guanylyltransferase